MDHTLFFVFSFIEFSAIFTLILALFLFNLRAYRSHILFSAFILTQASYLLRFGAELESVAVLGQLVLFILLFRLMFQIPLFYSALMGIIGFILGVLVQMFIVFFASMFSPYTFQQFVNNEPQHIGYIIQVLTAIVVLIFAWLLTRYRIGFSFIPDTDTVHVQFNSENILFLSLMSLGVVTLLTLYNFIFDTNFSTFVLLFLLIAQALLLLFLALRKEKSND